MSDRCDAFPESGWGSESDSEGGSDSGFTGSGSSSGSGPDGGGSSGSSSYGATSTSSSTSGGSGSGGSSGGSGSSSSSGGSGTGGSSSSSGSRSDAGGSSSGSSGSGSSGCGDSGNGGLGDAGPVVAPPGCTLPATVSFKTDVEPFLATTCGNAGVDGAGGCYVIDATSTVAAGGFDHAYDWITGTAHSSSCPEAPTPFRFQVAIAVINQANPCTCSKSRVMPPSGTTLSACEIATLQSWLNEPLVTQVHRADGISPPTPYAMPPFN